MADNTDEKPLNPPPNNESEKTSETFASAEGKKTLKPNQDTENMEVHKHPHHVTHKKKNGKNTCWNFLCFSLQSFLDLSQKILEKIPWNGKGKKSTPDRCMMNFMLTLL